MSFLFFVFFLLSDTATTFFEPDSSNASWAWPGGSDWQSANPGDSIISDCKNWYNTTDTVGFSAILLSQILNVFILFLFHIPS